MVSGLDIGQIIKAEDRESKGELEHIDKRGITTMIKFTAKSHEEK